MGIENFTNFIPEESKVAKIPQGKKVVKKSKTIENKPSETHTQQKTERIPIAVEKLREQAEQMKDVKLRPRVAFLGDSDKIENQQIDVIDAEDLGAYQVTFKLTAKHFEEIKQKLGNKTDFDSITYFANKPQEENNRTKVQLAQAWKLVLDEITIKISRGSKKYETLDGEKELDCNCSVGLVQISVPKNIVNDVSGLNAKIDSVFGKILDVPNGLETPTEQDEKKYKYARYAWHHKLAELPTKQKTKIADKLQRKEVAPGYFTFVEHGRHNEYKKISNYAIYHGLCDNDTLPDIIKAGGLLCTHERYRRGLLNEGMSSDEDLKTGGADNVFTRVISMDALRYGRGHYYSAWGSSRPEGSVVIIMSPDVLDRTDWYAYYDDCYGKTEPDVFETRQSPTEMFKQHSFKYNESNEQMFRLGISTEQFVGFGCGSFVTACSVYQKLIENGVSHMGGKPIEKCIFITESYDKLIDVSMGTKKENAQSIADYLKNQPGEVWRQIYSNAYYFLEEQNSIVSALHHLAKNLNDIGSGIYFDLSHTLTNILDLNPDIIEKNVPIKFIDDSIDKILQIRKAILTLERKLKSAKKTAVNNEAELNHTLSRIRDLKIKLDEDMIKLKEHKIII